MRNQRAQAILEFTFAALIFIMLAWGMTRIMEWSYQSVGGQYSRFEKCVTSGSTNFKSGACKERAIGLLNTKKRWR